MAIFTNLYHASDVLRHILDTQISPSNGVLAAPPLDVISTNEEIRISLLWVNEQPTHRNDSVARNANGTIERPPMTLSVFYLITAYGEGPLKNADPAHRLLGEVARIFHDEPLISLPLSTLVGNSGEGKLGISLVPMTPEIMEKVFAPLQIKHRPFLLYEVGPIQLRSSVSPGPPGPIVAPGGVVLEASAASKPPAITRVVPYTQAEGGYLRIDGDWGSPVDAIRIGSTRISNGISTIVPGRSIRVQLPFGGPEAVRPGVYPVSVVSKKLQSDVREIRVVAAGQWLLDGPATFVHSRAVELVLQGQGLDLADQLFVWPESGIRAPSDVKTFSVTATPTSISTTLTDLPPGEYRMAARIQPGPGLAVQFTPYITLEVVK